jgi:hypothetical protein
LDVLNREDEDTAMQDYTQGGEGLPSFSSYQTSKFKKHRFCRHDDIELFT